MQDRIRARRCVKGLALLVAAFAVQNAGRVAGAGEPQAARATAELHRALGLLQYVYGDYEVAVGDDGVILDEAEFLEQHQILDTVTAILDLAVQANLPAPPETLAALRDGIEATRDAAALRQPPTVVQAEVRRLRDAIIVAYGLRLAPERPPRLERGAALYEQACASCHGSDGRARTPLGLTLTPPPTDFHAPRLRTTLSPYQAFNVVSFGVPGTAMPSFEALALDERWDLAFHVVSLRHEPVLDGRAGQAPAAAPTLAELASFTDAELGDWFAARGVGAAEKNRAVARARHLPAH